MTEQIPLGYYQHYKGPCYQLLHVARHSETEEYYAVYKPLYGAQEVWIRPLAMFTESVDVAGRSEPRFRYLSPEAYKKLQEER